MGKGWRLQYEVLANGPASADPSYRSIRHAAGPARGRPGISPTRIRLRRVPYSVRDIRTRSRCAAPASRREQTTRLRSTMNRSARFVLAIVFVGLLLTPFLIRRFGQRTALASPAGHGDSLAQYGFHL